MSRLSKAERAELETLRASFAEQVAERVDLVLRAKRIAPNADYSDCRTPAEIRARAVAEVRGLAAIEGRSDDYVHAHFDALAAASGGDPLSRSQVLRH